LQSDPGDELDFSDLHMPLIEIGCQDEVIFAPAVGSVEGDKSQETEESRGFYPEKVAEAER